MGRRWQKWPWWWRQRKERVTEDNDRRIPAWGSPRESLARSRTPRRNAISSAGGSWRIQRNTEARSTIIERSPSGEIVDREQGVRCCEIESCGRESPGRGGGFFHRAAFDKGTAVADENLHLRDVRASCKVDIPLRRPPGRVRSYITSQPSIARRALDVSLREPPSPFPRGMEGLPLVAGKSVNAEYTVCPPMLPR